MLCLNVNGMGGGRAGASREDTGLPELEYDGDRGLGRRGSEK